MSGNIFSSFSHVRENSFLVPFLTLFFFCKANLFYKRNIAAQNNRSKAMFEATFQVLIMLGNCFFLEAWVLLFQSLP